MFDTRRWRMNIHEKGAEREPVITVDGFAIDPAFLVQHACTLRFAATTPYYPGIRADLGSDACDAMMSALAPLSQRVFGVTPALEAACYSLVTTLPAQLAPIQRLPHFDGMEAGRLALILYLCDPRHGGTAFYRHRSTGFETVSKERLDAYRAALAEEVRRYGLPPASYIGGDTPLFERIAAPAPALNRALIYRGRNLHSGEIAPDSAFSSDPRKGRLTITAFMV